jgi:hypothetical protein
MISIKHLFEATPTNKQLLKQSGKLIGSGIGIGLTGVGKLMSSGGQQLYNKLNQPTPSNPLPPKDPKKAQTTSDSTSKPLPKTS